ncbi:MAG: alanine:cation symporter family protein [Cyclobacteriaceae bacterium]|nr:alanine:cation symporter family protein [Cyclobacteriaceae bacterium HetDA_MAG_MS6]
MEDLIVAAANLVWGMPLLILLLGGGAFFMIYSRFLPFRYFKHAINILRGKYDDPNDPGQINHFQALSGALAATIGMGNISGVALAIAAGGPGAIFWMWVSAFFGISTKFFTCTLAVMYRGKDSTGELQGGPMYVITEGLGKKWKPLAIFFSIAGFFGATPVFQTNQIVAALKDIFYGWNGDTMEKSLSLDAGIGVVIAILVALVTFGGIKRIGTVAARLVPSMVVLYVASVLLIIALNIDLVLPSFVMIFKDAFSAQAALGGALGALIIEGAKRAAFSNEAGIGTAPMMHGAAKTKEPVREGLVAMLGPAIDTIVICTMTGLCILITGAWQYEESNGILLTSRAFAESLSTAGPYILVLSVLVFAFTTIFGLSYYGRKCLSFLIGVEYGKYFDYWYIGLILVGAVASLDIVVNLVFIAYGLMAIPTMISAVLLAPKVLAASRQYFNQVKD